MDFETNINLKRKQNPPKINMLMVKSRLSSELSALCRGKLLIRTLVCSDWVLLVVVFCVLSINITSITVKVTKAIAYINYPYEIDEILQSGSFELL